MSKNAHAKRRDKSNITEARNHGAKRGQKGPFVSNRQLTDRAHRYRAQHQVATRDRCIYCGAPRPRDIDHIDGRPDDDTPANLAAACHRCNSAKGLLFARLGLGRRTRQFNPRRKPIPKSAGAYNLAQWIQAVMSIKGQGPWTVQEGVTMIRATPPADRSAYASEIWRRRRARGTAGSSRLRLPEDDIPF